MGFKVHKSPVTPVSHTDQDVPVGAPIEKKRALFGTGRRQPVNPQWVPKVIEKEREKLNPGPRRNPQTAGDVIIENKRGVKLSEDTAQRMLDSYAAARWYRGIWAFFRRFDMKSLLVWRMPLHTGIVILALSIEGILIGIFYLEKEAYSLLDPDEQKDYHKVIMGMRISEAKRIGDEILEKEDPLITLPVRERMKIVVARYRELGLHNVDWELENRKLKTTWWEDLDYHHGIYWTSMWMGRWINGGRDMFENPDYQLSGRKQPQFLEKPSTDVHRT